MSIIRLSRNDIKEMVMMATKKVISESLDEKMGSAMYEKEDVIEEIVEYVKEWWDENMFEEPTNVSTFSVSTDRDLGGGT